MVTYISMADGKTEAPAPPDVISLPESTTRRGDAVVTKLVTVRKGDPGYDDAVERWMYLNGYAAAEPAEREAGEALKELLGG